MSTITLEERFLTPAFAAALAKVMHLAPADYDKLTYQNAINLLKLTI